MGFIAKLEDKLTGSSKKDAAKQEQQELEKDQLNSGAGMSDHGNHSSSTGGTGSATHDVRHPGQSATGEDHNTPNTGSDRDGYGSQPHGDQSGVNKMLPHRPADPYSSRGQNEMYGANSGDAKTLEHGRRSAEDLRRHGGSTEPAIPTAGGRELGESGTSGHSHGHHGRDEALAGGAGATGLGGHEARKHHDQTGSHDTPSYGAGSQDQHHYGRDAALAGGAGAAGLGAYEADKHHDRSGMDPRSQQDPSYGSRGQDRHHHGRDEALPGGAGATGLAAHEANKHHNNSSMDPRSNETSSYGSQGPNEPHYSSQGQNQHHYGRDAAAAGGAGAAGLGAYESSRDHGHGHNTGPASNTLGPHDSNAANVMDPRVKPEPEKMKDRTTAGPHNSDMLNKMDPRVTSDPAKAAEKEEQHHYGRDAALAGGAGAAGVGAYEADKHHRDHPQQSGSSSMPGAFEPSSGYSGSNQHGLSHSREEVPPYSSSGDDRSHGHRGRDEALAGGAGAAALGGHEAKKHHGHHNEGESRGLNDGSSSHGSNGGSGLPGMSSAGNKSADYEAGYRDAMAHAQARR